MLPRNKRIPKKDFKYILTKGKRISTSHLLLYIVKGYKEEGSRFSFSVSKKVAKSAVLRNKLRRQGYSSLEDCLLKVKKGYFFFFSIKSRDGLDYKVMKKEVLELLSNSLMLI